MVTDSLDESLCFIQIKFSLYLSAPVPQFPLCSDLVDALSSLKMGKHQIFNHVNESSNHDGIRLISKRAIASFAVGFEASQICRYPTLRPSIPGRK